MHAPNALTRRVVKVGGSLLTRPQLGNQLHGWLAQQPVAENLVIVGGGEAVDAMRRLQQLHRLDEAAMHWRCVRMLRASFEVLAELIDAAEIADSPENDSPRSTGDATWSMIDSPKAFAELRRQRPRPRHCLVAVETFFTPRVNGGAACSFDTTTDAIAAVLARQVEASEVVLLKSCAVPEGTLRRLSQAGIVDPEFPRLAAGIGDLRVERLPESIPS